MATIGQLTQQQQQIATKAAQPAIAALQAKEDPLKARFESILDRLTSRESANISDVQTTTSREFGRRGIPLSSGIFETSLGEKVAPIRERFAGLISETGAGRESALAQLLSQIAGVRSEALSRGASRALSLFQGQQARRESALDRAAAIREAQLNRSAARTANVPSPSFQQPRPQQINYSSEFKDDINQWLAGNVKGANFLTFVQTYAPFLSLQKITSLYNQTAGRRFGPPKESRGQINQAFLRGKQGVPIGPVR